MTAYPAFAACALLTLSAGIIAWRLSGPTRGNSTNYIIVLRDNSGSVSSGCDAIVDISRGEVQQAMATKHRLRVAMLFTGDISTADEPVMIHIPEFVPARKVLEGQSANSKHIERFLA